MVYKEPQRDESTPTVDYEQLWLDLRAAIRSFADNDPGGIITFESLDQTLAGMHDTAQFDAATEVRERLASL